MVRKRPIPTNDHDTKPFEMLANEHTAICTTTLILIPYSAHHVPKYHQWMADPEIQTLTASEPLTIEEEYDMQRSWRTDADKLTFIIGNRDPSSSQTVPTTVKGGEGYTPIGDINLFLCQDFDATSSDEGKEVLACEIELMIAEVSMRGKGLGRAALILFLQYVLANKAAITREYRAQHAFGFQNGWDFFRVKIGEHNKASRGLFEGLGFRQSGEVNFFGEVELRRTFTEGELGVLTEKYGFGEGREVRYVDVEHDRHTNS